MKRYAITTEVTRIEHAEVLAETAEDALLKFGRGLYESVAPGEIIGESVESVEEIPA